MALIMVGTLTDTVYGGHVAVIAYGDTPLVFTTDILIQEGTLALFFYALRVPL